MNFLNLPVKSLLTLFKSGFEKQIGRKVSTMIIKYKHEEKQLLISDGEKDFPFEGGRTQMYIDGLQGLVKEKLKPGNTLQGAKINYIVGKPLELEIFYTDTEGKKLIHSQNL